MIRFTKEQVILMHRQIIEETGGSFGLRDEGLLDSALMVPFQTFANKDLFLSIQDKAARLGYGIIKNHPFVDGNKRIGTHVMLVFLYCNNVELLYTQKELSDFILQIAAGKKDFDDFVKWIKNHQL